MISIHHAVPQEALNEYVNAALEGDEVAAGRVIDNARSTGASIAEIYLTLFVPAQRELGLRWLSGDISIGTEHRATELALRLMDRLRASAFRKPPLGKRVALAGAPEERHAIGARIIADFLHLDGWEVDFLGADLPAEDLASFVRANQPDLVAISVILSENLQAAREAVTAAKSAAPGINVLLGGPAVEGRHHALELGANGYAADALSALEEARRLVNVESGESLELLLTSFGSRVQKLRRERGWNQTELGKLSGLDRTYISGIEHGKQNMTLSVLQRIAAALDVAPASLLTFAD